MLRWPVSSWLLMMELAQWGAVDQRDVDLVAPQPQVFGGC